MQVNTNPLREHKGATLSAEGAAVLGGDLGPDFTPAAPARVAVDIVNTGSFLHLTGRAEAELTTVCTRCLQPAVVPMDVRFERDILPAGWTAPVEDLPEDTVVLTGEVVDLAPIVTEAVLLDLPMQPLCRPDCRGLCGVCGRNLNEGQCGCAPPSGHPGLAVLSELLTKKEV